MEKKSVGSLSFSSVCLGGNVFGWTVDESTSVKLLDAFVAGGGNFVDTADVYSKWVPGHTGGESETIIGRWMRERKNRAQMVISTKVGMELAPDKKGLAKNYILKAVEDSLRRLQTDYIDVYFSHAEDKSVPIEETLEAYAQLIRQGKVRALGASNYSAEGLQEALRVAKNQGLPTYEFLQPLYNLYDRASFEKDLLPICEKAGISVTPYYGLASGFLTGKYRSDADLGKSPRGGGIGKYMNERGFRILEALDVVANEQRTSPAAVAIAWLMTRPTIGAPIASATTTSQMGTLIEASGLRLASSSLEILERASKP